MGTHRGKSKRQKERRGRGLQTKGGVQKGLQCMGIPVPPQKETTTCREKKRKGGGGVLTLITI